MILSPCCTCPLYMYKVIFDLYWPRLRGKSLFHLSWPFLTPFWPLMTSMTQVKGIFASSYIVWPSMTFSDLPWPSRDLIFKVEVASELRRPRSVSVIDKRSSTLEPTTSDYVEVTSIPPLPLYALLAVDRQTGVLKIQIQNIYRSLPGKRPL